MKYTIKAIPTVYSGVKFRSRLEARWAALFDQFGWNWEYEPFDLDGWIPDFSISSPGRDRVLVEVKPFEFHDWSVRPDGQHERIEEMYQKALPQSRLSTVLLLGIGPFEQHGQDRYHLGMTAEENAIGEISFKSVMVVSRIKRQYDLARDPKQVRRSALSDTTVIHGHPVRVRESDSPVLRNLVKAVGGKSMREHWSEANLNVRWSAN